MIPTRPCRLLLLSNLPEMLFPLIQSFEAEGASIRVAREPRAALRQLQRDLDYVFVDLAHGAALDPELVRELNRGRNSRMVVGLHAGTLDALPDFANDLMPSAYLDCRDTEASRSFFLDASTAGSRLLH